MASPEPVSDSPGAPGGVEAAATGFPPVLTTAMAAELLQVHVEYLRRMVREGRIPCHRFPGGREMRFLRDELLEWLAALPGEDQSSTGRTQLTDPIGT
jgi:excisionase family DNA binding protein